MVLIPFHSTTIQPLPILEHSCNPQLAATHAVVKSTKEMSPPFCFPLSASQAAHASPATSRPMYSKAERAFPADMLPVPRVSKLSNTTWGSACPKAVVHTVTVFVQGQPADLDETSSITRFSIGRPTTMSVNIMLKARRWRGAPTLVYRP